jgi:hypothetical protein
MSPARAAAINSCTTHEKHQAPPVFLRGLGMAGYLITPVLVFWTLRDLHWEFLRLWTGFELSSSWPALPCYGPSRNRNILDFMK